jgi:hypothetical protein
VHVESVEGDRLESVESDRLWKEVGISCGSFFLSDWCLPVGQLHRRGLDVGKLLALLQVQ